ncbi:DNA cytosine methyltransferase [Desulfovibrio aminophilus]|nr:DNA cytosine methyltransferase [Desulfovibrio aminophilus]MCM0754771.1 DNA cytosine methyltransferase [Desulfovibrio aminophilus]
MRSVELFAGAGGLAMGATLAGFEHAAVIEWDKWACDTVRENQRRDFPLVRDWPLIEGDVRAFDYSSIQGEIDLLAGGPPCQPFSLGGKHRAHSDRRDMFPAAIEAVRRLRPRAFLIENVRGLTRGTFANYLQYIKLGLAFPEATRREDETWIEHLARLERLETRGHEVGLVYNIVARVLNAADYGIPQRRERFFIVGFRNDLGVSWNFPAPTHSLDVLLADQWINKTYWDRHEVARRRRPELPTGLKRRVAKLDQALLGEGCRPWRTVRDALRDLPDPRDERESDFHHNHRFQPGARVYPGHTGSPLDLPAKTLKAGDHGVPGGENMLVAPDGGTRYFTVRESARLQTFPDGYVLHGSWSEAMRQLGNAVPVALARLLAAGIAEKLVKADAARLAKERAAA